MSNSDRSETGILEKYRVAHVNAVKQPQIAAVMTEYGYDATEMAVGKSLLDNATSAYAVNKTESDEERAAYAVFDANRTKLDEAYTNHRKKAKVVFKTDPVTAGRLGIVGLKPRTYTAWLEAVRKFYSETISDTDVQNKLARLKITLEDLTAAQALIPEVGTSRATYLKECGESQEATSIKDESMKKIENWMNEFYSVARIALEDSPQLLEALGLIVRN